MQSKIQELKRQKEKEQEDKQLMAKIFNEVINDAGFQNITGIAQADEFRFYQDSKLIYWEQDNTGLINGRNRLIPLFDKLIIDKKDYNDRIYHFKGFDIALAIIRNREMQMTSVFYHKDKAEFSEFLKVSGYEDNVTNKNIDDEKKRVFILCFSKNHKEPKLWSEHAQNDTGVCLSIRIKHKRDYEYRYLCQFRDVLYDDGSIFNFVKVLRSACLKSFNKELFIHGTTKLAQFYKRSCYDWEDETRISFYIDPKNNGLKAGQILPIVENRNAKGDLIREYITINFDNDFFKLEIDEVICGKKVTSGQIVEIKKAINDSSVKVVRRM